MKKRFISVLLCLTLALSLFTAASAAEISAVEANLPQINATVNVPAGSKLDANAIKATIDGKPLKVNAVEADDQSTEWLVLIDTSQSLSLNHFESEKKAVLDLYKTLGENDTLRLYTFDTHLIRILDGTESAADVEKAVKGLKCNGQDTVFNDALIKLARMAKATEADKCVPVIFSDGVDTLSKTTTPRTKELLKETGVAVKGYYPSATKQQASKDFNDMLASSGGKAESFTTDNISSLLTKANGESKAVKLSFTADESIAANDKAVISIDLGDGKPVTAQTAVKAWEPSQTGNTTADNKQTSAANTEKTDSTTAAADKKDSDKDDGINPIIFIIAAALIIALVAVLAVLKKKGGKKEKPVKQKAEKAEKAVNNTKPEKNEKEIDKPEAPVKVPAAAEITEEINNEIKTEPADDIQPAPSVEETAEATDVPAADAAPAAPAPGPVISYNLDTDKKKKKIKKGKLTTAFDAPNDKPEAEKEAKAPKQKKEKTKKNKEEQQFQFYFVDNNKK